MNTKSVITVVFIANTGVAGAVTPRATFEVIDQAGYAALFPAVTQSIPQTAINAANLSNSNAGGSSFIIPSATNPAASMAVGQHSDFYYEPYNEPPYDWSPRGSFPAVWTAENGWFYIDTPHAGNPGAFGFASAVNNAGQVVGNAAPWRTFNKDPNWGLSDVTGYLGYQENSPYGDAEPFVWQNWQLQLLNDLTDFKVLSENTLSSYSRMGYFQDFTDSPAGGYWNVTGFDLSGWSANNINESGQIGLLTQSCSVNGCSSHWMSMTFQPDWSGESGAWGDTQHWSTSPALLSTGQADLRIAATDASLVVSGDQQGMARSLEILGNGSADSTLNLNGGNTAVQFGTTLGNGGILTGNGSLQGALDVQTGGQVEVLTGQSMTIDGTVVNNGAMSVNGDLHINGDFSGAGSVLGNGQLFIDGNLRPGNSPAQVTVDSDVSLNGLVTMELGGTTVGSEYDKLVFNGDVVLDQVTLAVIWWQGFSGEAGDVFDLFDWNGQRQGTFNSVLLPELANGLRWNVSKLYAEGQVSIAAVPVPSAVWLMGSGLLGLVSLRRRCHAG